MSSDGGLDATSDAGPGDSATGDATVATPCEDYCALVAADCKGDVRNQPPRVPTAQYQSTPGCLHACSNMAPGAPTDQEGDSIACRTYHAGAPAKADPGTHCPHAGVAGGGVCSGPVDSGAAGRCASFCHLALALCAPSALKDAGVAPPFSSESACLSACGKQGERSFDFDSQQNELTLKGDTLNCRQYHLGAAYNDPANPDGSPTESAKTYCPFLAATGGVIGPPSTNPCLGSSAIVEP